jgi:ABC-type lipoprotein release transport system permease subunit
MRAGGSVGASAASVCTRTLKSALFGVSALDPWTLLGAVGLLAAVSLIAACFPARRAAAVDPLNAIRAE